MNTPAHVVLNLLVLSPRDRPRLFTPVTLGAVLPDAPMFAFYLPLYIGYAVVVWVLPSR